MAGITAIALALRLPSFNDSLFMDEIGTNFVVHGFGVGNVLEIVGSDQEGTPPLFFLVAWLTDAFDGAGGMRLGSLIAGLAAIPLIYLLGLRTVGRPAATVAAVLVAVSPFQIFYATEARAYALVMLFCLLAALALLYALDSGRRWLWVAYALFVAAAVYTHYNAIFVVFALFAWAFVVRPEARRPLLLANLGAALLFAPWLPEYMEDRGEAAAKLTEVLHPLTLRNIRSDLIHWSIAHPFIPTSRIPGHLGVALIAGGLLLGAAGLLLRIRSVGFREVWPPSPRVTLVVILAAAAPVGAAIYSMFGDSIFTFRALITSWPGFALVVGALVTAGRPPLRIAATGLLIAGFVIGGLRMLDEDNQRTDLAEAVEFIEQSGEPDSPVVEVPWLTPGLQTPVEAELAPEGEPLPQDRQILPLSYPSFDTRLGARRNAVPALTQLPAASEQEVARRAAQLAGEGTLFLVVPGSGSIDELRATPGPAANFIAALPSRFREVGSTTVPGLGIFDATVYAFRADGDSS